MTVTKKSWTPGRARRKPLKPLCGESRREPVNLRWTYSYAFHSACEAAGAFGHPAFPAPSQNEGHRFRKARAHSAPRECGCVSGRVTVASRYTVAGFSELTHSSFTLNQRDQTREH